MASNSAKPPTRLSLTRLPLRLSYDAGRDLLVLCEYGTVPAVRDPSARVKMAGGLRFLLRRAGGSVIGFSLLGLHEFAPEAYGLDLFRDPRFTVPALGLRGAPVGEILLAARPAVGTDSTVDVLSYEAGWEALRERDPEAARRWFRAAIEAGELRGHLGLAAALTVEGLYPDAYSHARCFTELAPRDPWGWLWLGRICVEQRSQAEAARALRRTVRLEGELGIQTPASGMLRLLRAGGNIADEPDLEPPC